MIGVLPIILINVLGLFFFSPALYAQHLPLWEAGVGVAAARVPAYRGSQTVDYYAIPYPFFVYRGEKVRVDDDGIAGRIFEVDRVRLDLSLGGNTPVRREAHGQRVGMPALSPVIEIGPTVNVRLDDKTQRGRYWGLHLSLRPVVSTGVERYVPDLSYQGWVFAPHLEWRTSQRLNGAAVALRTTLGPLFGDADYHNYFYRVDDAYATAYRPAYTAHGGYSGSRLTNTLSVYSAHDLSLSFYMRYDELSGATFEHSPLVADRHYLVFGLAGTWVFMQSEKRVDHF